LPALIFIWIMGPGRLSGWPGFSSGGASSENSPGPGKVLKMLARS